MKVPDIKNDKDLYRAISEYSSRVWEWRGHLDEDYEQEPTPDEFINMLKERIRWVREHTSAINRYLLKRNRASWYRVIEGDGKGQAR